MSFRFKCRKLSDELFLDPRPAEVPLKLPFFVCPSICLSICQFGIFLRNGLVFSDFLNDGR